MKAWIARDKNGSLFIYFDKRIFKDNTQWKLYSGYCKCITDADLPKGINPQWSDDEPIEVELKIERVNVWKQKQSKKE